MGGSGAYMVTNPGHRPLSEAELNKGAGIDMFNLAHRYAVKYSRDRSTTRTDQVNHGQ